jgi:hypothetical protein
MYAGCADSIVLNPVKTSSGYSLNLKKGKTITIDQGFDRHADE